MIDRKPEPPATVLCIYLIACLSLQAWLAMDMEINWDEFFFLAQIYSYQSGELTKVLQELHVHLLGWVTAVPRGEIAQVEAGRLFMLGCFAGTCALIYAVARAFASRAAAIFAALAFASMAFSIIHGASFRADPVAAVLMIGSLAILARSRLTWVQVIAAGLLAAVAAMITVKVVLYAPAFLGVAAWRVLTATDRRSALFRFGVAALAALAGCITLYFVQLALVPQATSAAAKAGLGNAAETQFTAGLFPRAREILQLVLLTPLPIMLFIAGIVASAALLRRSSERAQGLALVGCAATVTCLAVYRNAFPYFFPFIFAPAAVVVAVAADRFDLIRKHLVLLAVGLLVPSVLVAREWSSHGQRAQQQIVTVVHRMFPRAVPYIDRNSMIASFPKRGFFMSTWGMQGYRRARQPVFARVLAGETVPLVIANGPALENAFGFAQQLPTGLALLDADKGVLRTNFVHYWGPIWVAGKSIDAKPGQTLFSVMIPGAYAVEGPAHTIDGTPIVPGKIVFLGRGNHSLNTKQPGNVTLRWANLPRPPLEPFAGPVYRGF